MPFKSKAQRRKFAELLVNGEISPETYEEWNRETGSKQLPERVKPKARQEEGQEGDANGEEGDEGERRRSAVKRVRQSCQEGVPGGQHF